MSAFFEIAGLNVYVQIIVTVISIVAHLFGNRKGTKRVPP
jgi:hypothetical protein